MSLKPLSQASFLKINSETRRIPKMMTVDKTT